jgi:hypothetical protein
MLIACYVPPGDSPYHSFAPLAVLKDRIKGEDQKDIILIGDHNARFREERASFLRDKDLPPNTYYSPSPDPIRQPNSNAKYIASIAKPLLLLNNLNIRNHTYESALTYHQGDVWISELDVCLASVRATEIITDFSVYQRIDLPSDHAPIAIKQSRKRRKTPDAGGSEKESREPGEILIRPPDTGSKDSEKNDPHDPAGYTAAQRDLEPNASIRH